MMIILGNLWTWCKCYATLRGTVICGQCFTTIPILQFQHFLFRQLFGTIVKGGSVCVDLA